MPPQTKRDPVRLAILVAQVDGLDPTPFPLTGGDQMPAYHW